MKHHLIEERFLESFIVLISIRKLWLVLEVDGCLWSRIERDLVIRLFNHHWIVAGPEEMPMMEMIKTRT